jgi:hypothetical protein
MRGNRHYVHLAIMIALSFISMYVLMVCHGEQIRERL